MLLVDLELFTQEGDMSTRIVTDHLFLSTNIASVIIIQTERESLISNNHSLINETLPCGM